MALNEVQVRFVNEAARVHMEAMVRTLHVLDTFVANYGGKILGGTNATITTTVAG